MINKLICIILIILPSLNSYANPAPLGFELNKTTISEVEKLYPIIKKETNYWQGYNYYLNVKDVKLDGLNELLIICDEADIIQSVILTIDNNKFTEFYELLSDKYKLVQAQITSLTSKETRFIDSDCTIILDVPSFDFNMSLIYITNEFLIKFETKQQEETIVKKAKNRELL
jgi:hypothetical protein